MKLEDVMKLNIGDSIRSNLSYRDCQNTCKKEYL